MNWMEVTRLFSKNPPNYRTSTLTSQFLVAFLKCTHYRKLIPLLMHVAMYAIASNNTPSYTHISLYVV
jgi:hypothetical protein